MMNVYEYILAIYPSINDGGRYIISVIDHWRARCFMSVVSFEIVEVFSSNLQECMVETFYNRHMGLTPAAVK